MKHVGLKHGLLRIRQIGAEILALQEESRNLRALAGESGQTMLVIDHPDDENLCLVFRIARSEGVKDWTVTYEEAKRS